MLKGTLHQRIGSGMTVLFQQPLVKAAAVDTDTDRDFPIFADIHNCFYSIFSADITGVDADLGSAAFRSSNGQLIVKVDIRNQRQRTFLADFRKASCALHIRHSQSGDLTAGCSQLTDLGKRTFYIRSFGVEHGLDHHRRTAADENTANIDLSGHIDLLRTAPKYLSA